MDETRSLRAVLMGWFERWRWWLGGIGLALVVVVVALIISGGDETPTAAETTTTTVTTAPIDGETTSSTAPTTTTTLPNEPTSVNPLTGEALTTEVSARVIAVKVDNAPPARPQIGLGRAEMVIETLVEGGLTRFSALYFEEIPQVVGPVRSIRTYDADLLAPFRPVLVFTGGQDFVYRVVEAAGIGIFDTETSPEVFQLLERPAPYDLFATLPIVADQRDGSPLITPFQFGSTAGLDSGAETRTVEIPFSADTMVRWVYDGDRYVRAQNGEPFLVYPQFDAAPVQLDVDTLVILFAAARSAGYTDVNGSDVPTFDVIGFGRAVVVNGGRALEGEWRRSSQEDGYLLFDDGGNPVSLPTGTVFVEIVPRSMSIVLE